MPQNGNGLFGYLQNNTAPLLKSRRDMETYEAIHEAYQRNRHQIASLNAKDAAKASLSEEAYKQYEHHISSKQEALSVSM